MKNPSSAHLSVWLDSPSQNHTNHFLQSVLAEVRKTFAANELCEVSSSVIYSEDVFTLNPFRP